MTRESTSSAGITRRNYLGVGALAVAGLAGCTGSSDEADPGAQAVAVVESVYEAYNDQNLQRVQELAHEEYPGEITAENFEEFGGLENMSFELTGTEIPRESEELVEVHAEVTISTPGGPADNVDYFLLLPEDGEWRYAALLPEPIRETMNQTAIDEAMRRG